TVLLWLDREGRGSPAERLRARLAHRRGRREDALARAARRLVPGGEPCGGGKGPEGNGSTGSQDEVAGRAQTPCPRHSAARTARGAATPDQRQASLRQAAAADSCSVGSTTGAAPPAIPTRRQAPSRSRSSFPSASARAPSFPTDSQDRT